jgi:hypothetical protein
MSEQNQQIRRGPIYLINREAETGRRSKRRLHHTTILDAAYWSDVQKKQTQLI